MTAPQGAGALGALAADLEALTHTVEQLARETADNSQSVAAVHRAVRTLAETVAATAAATGDADDAEDDPGTVAPWLVAAERADAVRDLGRLVAWLGDVYVHYHDADLAACWMWHPGVVAELMALRNGWVAAHYGPRASATAVMDWHDRYRPGTVRRVVAELSSCRLEHHTPAANSHRPPTVPGVALAGEIVTWWTGTHGTSAPPSPTPDMLAEERAAHAARSRDY